MKKILKNYLLRTAAGILTMLLLLSMLPAAITASAQTVTQNFPFPQAGSMTQAIQRVMPSNRTQAQMNQDVVDQFKKILQDFIIDPNTDSANNPDAFRMALLHSDGGGATSGQVTCSESMGYGMLMLVLMAGQDDQFIGNLNSSQNLKVVGGRQLYLKDYFDGMFRSLMKWPSIINVSGSKSHLMAWELLRDSASSPWRTGSGADSATDGDLDMAYALLLADKQWGSGGTYDYLSYAESMINDLWMQCVDRTGSNPNYHIKVGDWASSGKWPDGTRPSDFITGHLKAFKEADPAHNWQLVIDATYECIRQITQQQSTVNGLLPDFAVLNRSTGTWSPAPSGWLEGTNDGRYSWNACRVPWRLASDILMHGDTAITGISGSTTLGNTCVQPLHNFLLNNANGNFSSVRANFMMNGSGQGYVGGTAFSSPLVVTSAVYGTTAQMTSGWDYARSRPREGDQYGDYINVLSMIAASGNFWSPLSSQEPMVEDVSFISVSANGGENAATTELIITFDKTVTGLTADDITISGTNVTKGALSGTGPVYSLAVTAAEIETVSVQVSKEGYSFLPNSRDADVYPSPLFNITDLEMTGSPIIGSPLTFTVRITGGQSPVKYAYYVTGEGNIHHKVVYSDMNNFTYTPEEIGNYSVRAYVIDNQGEKLVSVKSFTVV